MNPPRAFISHSSQDHETVRRLDRDLREAGIDPWCSFWEIKAGDSIVAKINEGLTECDAFLIVISKNSISSAWVTQELDAATVQNIKRQTTIIPVRLDDSPVPPLLDSLRYVELDKYEEAIAEIADVVHGRRTRPPVAAPDSHAAVGDSDTTLSGAPALILLESVRRADADEDFWGMDADEAMEAFDLTAEEYADAVEELHRLNLVILDGNMGHASGYARARIRPWAFFQVVDKAVPGVDARADLGQLLAAIATGGRQGIASQTVREAIDIPEPRARWYVEVLADQGLIEVHGTNGMMPLGFDWAQLTAAGRSELKSPRLTRPRRQPEASAPRERSSLSRRARILLYHAVQDRGANILLSHTFGGRHVHANEKQWPKEPSARAAAEWVAAVNELREAGLLEPSGTRGDVFTLNARGFAAADAEGIDAEE